MSEEKICFRCKRLIECHSEGYFAFIEIENAKKIRTDYAHKKCWNEFLDNIGSVKQAKGMLNQLGGRLRDLGLLPEQEVVVA